LPPGHEIATGSRLQEFLAFSGAFSLEKAQDLLANNAASACWIAK
jgi:hypothetical protein